MWKIAPSFTGISGWNGNPNILGSHNLQPCCLRKYKVSFRNIMKQDDRWESYMVMSGRRQKDGLLRDSRSWWSDISFQTISPSFCLNLKEFHPPEIHHPLVFTFRPESLAAYVALSELCDYAIYNDTGSAHVSSATGKISSDDL